MTFFIPTLSFAQIITGQVIRILDGDTLVILVDGRIQEKVRLTEIDAPEKNQAFGSRSRQALADLCFQKPATVTIRQRDRYDRLLGRVNCNGVDANAEQVRTGMAWVYNHYVKDKRLYILQEQAKQNRVVYGPILTLSHLGYLDGIKRLY